MRWLEKRRLRSRDPSKRARAISRLSSESDDIWVEFVIPLLVDPAPNVRTTALSALLNVFECSKNIELKLTLYSHLVNALPTAKTDSLHKVLVEDIAAQILLLWMRTKDGTKVIGTTCTHPYHQDGMDYISVSSTWTACSAPDLYEQIPDPDVEGILALLAMVPGKLRDEVRPLCGEAEHLFK